MLFWLILILGLLLDQATKYLASAKLVFGQPVELIPGIFQFNLVYNTGAAFSILKGHTFLFAIMAMVVLLILIIIYYFTPKEQRLWRIALSLTAAGILGNMVDRLRLGYVVDFFDCIIWPIFNVADTLLVVGAALLIIVSFRQWHKETKAAKIQGK